MHIHHAKKTMQTYINSKGIHPRNLTWIPNMAIFKRSHHFQTIILGIRISFRGCGIIHLIRYTWSIYIHAQPVLTDPTTKKKNNPS